MYEVGNKPIYLFKRPHDALDVDNDDYYVVEKTYANIHAFLNYLYNAYDESYGYWFDEELDLTGFDTLDEYIWTINENGFEKIQNRRRKRWMIAEEQNSDWLIVLNPRNYQSRVDDIIRRKGAKKQGPAYRKDPVPGTGKRKKGYFSSNRQVRHTSWYREEIARQKMDKDEYGKFHPTPQPKSLDWNFYHKHSHREFKSWKNQKIQRQWMKNMPRHKERLI